MVEGHVTTPEGMVSITTHQLLFSWLDSERKSSLFTLKKKALSAPKKKLSLYSQREKKKNSIFTLESKKMICSLSLSFILSIKIVFFFWRNFFLQIYFFDWTIFFVYVGLPLVCIRWLSCVYVEQKGVGHGI